MKGVVLAHDDPIVVVVVVNVVVVVVVVVDLGRETHPLDEADSPPSELDSSSILTAAV